MKTKGLVTALLTLVLFGGFSPSATAESGNYPYKCEKEKDSWGFGGTEVFCQYPCQKDSILFIRVTAKDYDAGTSGWTSCGGAYANCASVGWTCAGASATDLDPQYKGRTQYADTNGQCNGRSHEFWSSAVHVICFSVGPHEVACQTHKAVCEILHGLQPIDPDAARNLLRDGVVDGLVAELTENGLDALICQAGICNQ
jgi:hypothetical protein